MSEYLPDRIFAPDDTVRELAETEKTPFYLYDQSGIQSAVQRLHSSFSDMPAHQNYIPVRENPNPQILKLLCAGGTGVCACSAVELKLACACGFSGSQLLYEPNRRDPEAEALALEADAVWLINGEALLPQRLPTKVLLRYHPADRNLTPLQRSVVGKSKHGISRENLLALAGRLHRQRTQIGLAMQVSTYSIHHGFWARKASILLELAAELRRTAEVPVWACFIGEGPGLGYRPQAQSCDWSTEAEAVCAIFTALPEEERPVLLTGVCRRLLEPYGILVTKILEKRTNLRTFLVVDAGICQYLRPSLLQAYRHISVLGRREIENRRRYSIVGPLPDSFDFLDAKGRMLPQVVPGDYCVVHDVGCGSRAMAMLYGFQPVAAEYLYTPDGSFIPIAPGRTEEEVQQFLTAW